jgi:hypothetical protein
MRPPAPFHVANIAHRIGLLRPNIIGAPVAADGPHQSYALPFFDCLRDICGGHDLVVRMRHHDEKIGFEPVVRLAVVCVVRVFRPWIARVLRTRCESADCSQYAKMQHEILSTSE